MINGFFASSPNMKAQLLINEYYFNNKINKSDEEIKLDSFIKIMREGATYKKKSGALFKLVQSALVLRTPKNLFSEGPIDLNANTMKSETR